MNYKLHFRINEAMKWCINKIISELTNYQLWSRMSEYIFRIQHGWGSSSPNQVANKIKYCA